MVGAVQPDPQQVIVTRICRQLRALREERNISQQRLSEMAGISRTGLRHIESEKVNPTFYSLLKVADALDVDLALLIKQSTESKGRITG